MRRWSTEGFFSRCRLAAALMVGAIAAGSLAAVHAESSSVVTAGFSRVGLERIGDYMRHEIATGKIPGAIVLIQQHGKPVYFEKFGVRDVESRHPMTDDTIFRLYSMSKPITSVAAMMLVDDGKLALDDLLSKYIPAFADVKVGVERNDEAGKLVLEPLQRPITIEDLLRHTSGLTYGFYGDSAVRKLYANSDLFRGRFRQCRFCRSASQIAARRTAGDAVGLRPFGRYPGPRH